MLEDRDTDKLKRKRDEPVKKNKPKKDKNEKSKKFLKKSESYKTLKTDIENFNTG